MRVISFFANVENLMYISKIQAKIEQKLFVFEIIASELVALNWSLLRREYLSSAVIVLTNTYKALHLTKTDFFRLFYLQNDH